MRIFSALVLFPLLSMAQAPAPPGIMLEELTWLEAEKVLTPETVVVIPLGAAAKEHGPHLLLRNDLILADYFTSRVRAESRVVIAPTVTYHYYPAFVEYPGSTSLRLSTARDLVVDVVRSLARFGPRKFYILNTGISTVRALNPARDTLAAEGITLRFTDLKSIEPVEASIRQQEGGTHADEIETSMILYMKPDAVDMKRAVKDYSRGGSGLTRDPNNKKGTYSPSGVWGDATLATAEKGRIVTEALVKVILKDIEELRKVN
jgi:creatinine amidohydrolase